MKRILIFSLITIVAFGLVSSKVYSQTVEEIRAKMLEAQGGKKLLLSLKDSTMSGTMKMVAMNITGTMTMYGKEPDKLRMDIEMMGMQITQAYDGKTAWATNPQSGTAEEMPEKLAQEFRRQALGFDAQFNPEKYGITFSFKGKETLDGKEYLVIEQVFKDENKSTLYVDPATYLVMKTKGTTINQMEATVEMENIMSDYKKVDGVMVPHSLTIFQGGQEFMKLSINEVSFNSGLEDSLFKME